MVAMSRNTAVACIAITLGAAILGAAAWWIWNQTRTWDLTATRADHAMSEMANTAGTDQVIAVFTTKSDINALFQRPDGSQIRLTWARGKVTEMPPEADHGQAFDRTAIKWPAIMERLDHGATTVMIDGRGTSVRAFEQRSGAADPTEVPLAEVLG